MKTVRNSRSRTYAFGKSSLTLEFGNLVSSNAQVLVSSDDCYISMGGGISAAILEAGGEAIALDAAKKVPVAVGDVVVTTAGSLGAQYVFHAITMGPNSEQLGAAEIVKRTTRLCMQLLEKMKLHSIAFPAIGAGLAAFPYDEVAASMAEVVAEEIAKRTSPVEVTIFLFDRFGQKEELDFVRFFEEFATRAPRIANREVSAPQTPEVPEATAVDLATQTQEEYKRRRLHNLRKLLADLEDQRGRLEQSLIHGLTRPSEAKKIRQSLKQNQELRLRYLGELEAYKKPDAVPEPPDADGKSDPATVFVSSTYHDLVGYRAAVKEALSRCDLLFRGMEHFGADPDHQPPSSLIVQEVRKARVYLGLFGVRYGYVDSATGLSMTELEFREAEKSKKLMLLYVMHDEASVPVAHVERDPENMKKLATLKARITSNYVVYMFRNVDDLQRQVVSDLEKLKLDKKI